MGYKYEIQRSAIFTEAGQNMFVLVRDNVRRLLDVAGAVRMEEAIKPATGDQWTALACVDRMVERGELRELTTPCEVAGQHRVFVARGGA